MFVDLRPCALCCGDFTRLGAAFVSIWVLKTRSSSLVTGTLLMTSRPQQAGTRQNCSSCSGHIFMSQRGDLSDDFLI